MNTYEDRMSFRMSVAPMVDVTDRHFRYFNRLLTKNSYLYTEMISTGAIIHGDRHRILDFSPQEKPLVLQIGAAKPEEMVEAVKIAEDWDYDEINLNVGCPSNKVQEGDLGACLMAKPELVRDILTEARGITSKPVTVKHRIGIDDLDKYEDMENFCSIVEASGVTRYIVHARIAILKGLSPKDNRNIPPLRYEDVYRLKEEYPHFQIEINGGFKDRESILAQKEILDGVMLGRAAYERPYLLNEVENVLYPEDTASITRQEILEHLIGYIQENFDEDNKAWPLYRNIYDLFAFHKGAKVWKRILNEGLKEDKPGDALKKALDQLPLESLLSSSLLPLSS